MLGIRDRLLLSFTNKANAEVHLSAWHNQRSKSAGSAYDFFRIQRPTKPWASLVWDSLVTPKHSFILWLGMKGRLNTKDRLGFLEADSTCALCDSQPESVHHLFFECSISCGIWSNIRHWIGLHRTMSTLASAAKWIKKDVKGSSWQSKAKRVAFASSVYHIWLARNKRIFEGATPSVSGLIHQIKTHVFRTIYGHFPHLMAT